MDKGTGENSPWYHQQYDSSFHEAKIEYYTATPFEDWMQDFAKLPYNANWSLGLGMLGYRVTIKWEDRSSPKSIAEVGCALTCLAMVLHAYGFDVDPGGLNTWMNNRRLTEGGGYDDNHGVEWETAFYYAKEMNGGVDFLDKPQATVIDKNSTEEEAFDKIKDALERCKLVIAKVKNKNTGNDHFVLITGFDETTGFSIYDPGPRNETNLSDYEWGQQTIYKYVVFGKAQ